MYLQEEFQRLKMPLESTVYPPVTLHSNPVSFMIVDYQHYWDILSRVRRPYFTISTHVDSSLSNQSLESYMSYRLGSGFDGQTIPQLLCSNVIRKPSIHGCSNVGVLICSHCSLVKYCSGHCQRQHWSKHRLDCEHQYLSPEWEPDWILENREPLFSKPQFLPSSSSTDAYKNTGFPAYDCLQLPNNEGLDAMDKDLKICMTAAADIRNLVHTVNSLPNNYSGKIDFLLNNTNTNVVNRMLMVLCVLLNPGPTTEESAELATHLIYSASLSDAGASYVRHCANLIYGEESKDGELSFQTTLKTRGKGKLYSAQPATSIKRPIEMLFSSYSLCQSLASRKDVFQDPFHVDDRDKLLSSLQPSHRLALQKFWDSGKLAPFSMDLNHFTSPNRLMYSSQGEWLGTASDVNPLHGWDVNAVRRTGFRHGIDIEGDILGCLFFHVKSELREFSTRMKEFNINIHLLQYDSRLLSKGVSIGILPAFSHASFDRIDVGDMGDKMGISECLADWAPLLNKNNQCSCLVMHSKRWHEEFPTSIARNNPRAIKILMERFQRVPSLKLKLKTLFKGHQAPPMVRLMASLDAFVDHEKAFLEYLEGQEAQSLGSSLGINLRQVNSIHSKRVGIPLHSESQKLPNISKEEFYELFTIGGADLTIRFAEFESAILAQ